MKTFCIYCSELPKRREAAERHFQAMGVEATFIDGIHAETFGILAWRPFTRDYPEQGYVIPMSQVGLCLSHYMVWQLASHLPDMLFLILEDDAKFPLDWKSRLDLAMIDTPPDWDILLLGNANCSDKPRTHVKGDIWEIKYPFCTHAMLVHKRAFPVMLRELRDAAMKIDIGLILKVYPKLRVYTVWPRLVGQRGTELVE